MPSEMTKTKKAVVVGSMGLEPEGFTSRPIISIIGCYEIISRMDIPLQRPDLWKLMGQSGTPRFGFGTRGRLRRFGEHLPPRRPFGIGVARRGRTGEAEGVALFPGADFVGFEYV
jgi:hypothetical protein